MKGIYLKLYVHKNQKHKGVLLYDWLLQEAKKLGIAGGSAFQAVAAFGNQGILHEQRFIELGGGDLPVEVGFAMSENQADELLRKFIDEKIDLFYVKTPAEFGSLSTEF